MTVVINREEYETLVRDSEVLEIVKRLRKNLRDYDFRDAVDALFDLTKEDSDAE